MELLMAEATKTSKIFLSLTEEEAAFISAITQNALEPNESAKTTDLRYAIFTALEGLKLPPIAFEESP